MPIYAGSSKIKEFWAGNSKIKEVWAGSSKVWSSGPILDPVFANNDWDVIGWACDNKAVPNTWKVGDRKDAVINGENITFAIMGFNHDDKADGSGKAAITMGMVHLMSSARVMNSTKTTAGSFVGSELYSFLRDTVYAGMPSKLKKVIKPVKKKTSSGSLNSTIRIDTMSIWLFSEVEVFGTDFNLKAYAFPGEGTQYPYYTNSANRVKKRDNGAGTATQWWERSPENSRDSHFCIVHTKGYESAGFATNSLSISFGFCI